MEFSPNALKRFIQRQTFVAVRPIVDRFLYRGSVVVDLLQGPEGFAQHFRRSGIMPRSYLTGYQLLNV